jgi:glutaredoxin 3
MERRDMSTLTIYGKVNCPWCKDAKTLAEKYNIPYEYVNVGYTDGLKELMERVPDATSVPQIFWHDRYIGGYPELAREIENTMGGFGEQKI